MKFNDNFLYSSIFVNRLQFLGVQHAVISPGSRNTPLIAALHENTEIIKTIILDERSAAFFALGIAKTTKSPVLIVTTSGTAVAELYPAIVEAFQSRIPLIVCTADRPAELLNCGENQAINQDNIFINHIKSYYYFNNLRPSEDKLLNLINTTTHCFNTANLFNRGPVHINFPFSKPLEPNSFNIEISDDIFISITKQIDEQNNVYEIPTECIKAEITELISELSTFNKGIFIIGGGNYSDNFYDALYLIAKKLGFLIYADILSSFQFNINDKEGILINNLPFILEEEKLKTSIAPEVIIQFGVTPVNNKILEFYKSTNAKKVLINKYGDLYDPSRTTNVIYKCCENTFLEIAEKTLSNNKNKAVHSDYKYIINKNNDIERLKEINLQQFPFSFEGNLINVISKYISKSTPLVISNSMPVRYLGLFSVKQYSNGKIYCNRGASGIDGNTATAAGIAYSLNNPTILITGDLAFLHDIGSLIYINQLNIPLCIIVIDNNGGGIFNMLPIADNPNLLTPYFISPHNQNIKTITNAFGLLYQHVESSESLESAVRIFYTTKAPTVLHFISNINESTENLKKIKKAVIV
jgi:2-succinyl-5-enolpyruvyl-6-hydroxy-3-cyclohexene-1-carboxylate synthase